jgi:hypothetical protein
MHIYSPVELGANSDIFQPEHPLVIMSAPDSFPTVKRDGRLYLAHTSSVPTVYPLAIDEVARQVHYSMQ